MNKLVKEVFNNIMIDNEAKSLYYVIMLWYYVN